MLHMDLSYSGDVFSPSTHVEASLQAWPNNHVRGCNLKELFVAASHLVVPLALISSAFKGVLPLGSLLFQLSCPCPAMTCLLAACPPV